MAILLIRLSAMGDIIHTLPAAATLKKSFPNRKLVWLIAPRWMPLLEGNPFIDDVIPFDRSTPGALWKSARRLRSVRPEWAFDFQGLVYSALLGRAAKPVVLFGFDKSVAREPLASSLYSRRIPVTGPHRVERNVQLAAAVGTEQLVCEAWIPQGHPEGDLPSEPFVLTNPFAGWPGKEWPLSSFDALGQRLRTEGLQLVANIPANRVRDISGLKHIHLHTSTLPGLIDATRRATAVIGLDSGPLHLAAALRKPGVGLFGPTDPLRTGPFGGSMSIVRAEDVETTYKRHAQIHASMKAIQIETVAAALLQSLSRVAVQHP